MKTRRYLIGLIFFALVGSCPAATRSDQAKEKRWEEQIVPSLMVGEAVNLRANGTEFLGLYAPNTGEPSYGGVILIHGTGAHPAWPQIIEPLRIALPEHGWSTLSLQMPILANDAKQQAYLPLMPEAPLRIQAGVDFLKGKGVNNIVLIAHSMGATMANMYLADKPDPAVHGYIAIGMSNEFPKRYDNIMALGACMAAKTWRPPPPLSKAVRSLHARSINTSRRFSLRAPITSSRTSRTSSSTVSAAG